MGKFPAPVTFDDGSKVCKIFLTVPGLKVGRSGLTGKEVKNGSISQTLNPGDIYVQISTCGETYVYSKNLPDNIKPKESSVEPTKDEQVVVKLRKESGESWAPHSKYFVLP